jgi:hypothetical protein
MQGITVFKCDIAQGKMLGMQLVGLVTTPVAPLLSKSIYLIIMRLIMKVIHLTNITLTRILV